MKRSVNVSRDSPQLPDKCKTKFVPEHALHNSRLRNREIHHERSLTGYLGSQSAAITISGNRRYPHLLKLQAAIASRSPTYQSSSHDIKTPESEKQLWWRDTRLRLCIERRDLRSWQSRVHDPKFSPNNAKVQGRGLRNYTVGILSDL